MSPATGVVRAFSAVGPGEAAGGAASFGQIIRGSAQRNAAQPIEVAAAFLQVLRSRRSQWPATGETANRGPHASGRSVAAFASRQGRSVTGQFQPWNIINDATNDKGFPYAGQVDQGLRSDGSRVSASRFQANFRAVQRTWDINLGVILANADSIAEERRS